MKLETTQTLISYYKWAVNLSVVLIGATISFVSTSDNLRFSNVLVWGIFFLLLSVFFNWLIIKRLVSEIAIESEQVKSPLVSFFHSNRWLLGAYGLLQNWSFLIGFILIVLSFLTGQNQIGIQLNF